MCGVAVVPIAIQQNNQRQLEFYLYKKQNLPTKHYVVQQQIKREGERTGNTSVAVRVDAPATTHYTIYAIHRQRPNHYYQELYVYRAAAMGGAERGVEVASPPENMK